jgi:hypothetical protein
MSWMLDWAIWFYIYVCVYMYVCVYIYIYICVWLNRLSHQESVTMCSWSSSTPTRVYLTKENFTRGSSSLLQMVFHPPANWTNLFHIVAEFCGQEDELHICLRTRLRIWVNTSTIFNWSKQVKVTSLGSRNWEKIPLHAGRSCKTSFYFCYQSTISTIQVPWAQDLVLMGLISLRKNKMLK